MSKPKRINLELIHRDPNTRDGYVYEMMDSLIAKYHPHLVDAEIVLMWQTGWKEDSDGRLTLGRASLANSKAKEIASHDFVIELNCEFWGNANADMRNYMLDSKLEHCKEALDSEDVQKTDECGRKCWRIKKHDICEHTNVVGRHKVWSPDVDAFAKALKAKQDGPTLFEEDAA